LPGTDRGCALYYARNLQCEASHESCGLTAAGQGLRARHWSAFGCRALRHRARRGDVRKILQETADKIGPANAYKPNGHSDEYGYGLINAEEAVARALQLAAATPGAGTPARATGRRIRVRSARRTRRPSARPRHR
jgi:hypothetical protein